MLIRIEPIKAELQLNRIFQRCPTGEFHHLRSEEQQRSLLTSRKALAIALSPTPPAKPYPTW
jgi:hypothetical protein